MAGELVSCELPATARSVTVARRFVVDALTAWGRETLCDTAALLTSEVVTNAVLHARTSLELVVRRLDDGISIEVTDGSQQLPRQRRIGSQSTHGRGVALLDQLASTWDIQTHDSGKTVRFVISGDVDPWAAYSNHSWGVE